MGMVTPPTVTVTFPSGWSQPVSMRFSSAFWAVTVTVTGLPAFWLAGSTVTVRVTSAFLMVRFMLSTKVRV